MKRKIQTCFPFLLLISLGLVIGQETGTIERTLQLNEIVNVDWVVNFDEKIVTFTVTAQAKGFIGFGLSPQGGMVNADVIIGGVKDDGEVYFTDRFAVKEEKPKIDDHQDWFLDEAMENSTHTVLRFHRAFETCDPEDLPITADTTKFIWSLGTNDDIVYHEKRGAASVNILDPPMPAMDTSEFDIFDITVNTTIPTRHTSYWCTIHRSTYTTVRHAVAFEMKLDSDLALEFNHHATLHKCMAEPGSEANDILESFVGHPGGECYEPDGTGIEELTSFCPLIVHVWAKGGIPFFLPENVGYPMSEGAAIEYFMLEIHYDNPKVQAGVTYETGMRIYTTPDLREIEAGLIVLAYPTDISLVVPPSSENFVYAAHCSSGCTRQHIPSEGINVFSVLLHAHLAGRKLKLRHFRPDAAGNYTELPWAAVDNQYDFNFQQNRPYKQHLKLLPGDHLTTECTYDTTWRQPSSVTIGGFATRNEMCQSIVMYYPRLPTLAYCGSGYPLEQVLSFFGIEEIESTYFTEPLVLKPEAYANLTFTQVLDTKIEWTSELSSSLQQSVHFDDHIEECHEYNIGFQRQRRQLPKMFNDKTNSVVSKDIKDDPIWINYPPAEEYQPPSNCPSK